VSCLLLETFFFDLVAKKRDTENFEYNINQKTQYLWDQAKYVLLLYIFSVMILL
jgi:hypothetical protein